MMGGKGLRVKKSLSLPPRSFFSWDQPWCCSLVPQSKEGHQNSTCLTILFFSFKLVGFKAGSLLYMRKGLFCWFFFFFFCFVFPSSLTITKAKNTWVSLPLRLLSPSSPCSPPTKIQGEHTAHENLMPYVTKQNEYLIGAFMWNQITKPVTHGEWGGGRKNNNKIKPL